MAYSGTIPIKLSFEAVQALSVKNIGIFKIGYDNKLAIFSRINNLPPLYLDMGDGLVNKDVAEFTVIPNGYNRDFKVIIKNTDGKARYVTIHSSNKSPTYDEILTNVIKVAGGEILFEDKNKYVVSNGKYFQLGVRNTIDIIPNGKGGVKRITADNVDSKIKSVVGAYTLKKDGSLMRGTTKIGSNIISIGSFTIGNINGFLVGKSGIVFNSIKSEAHKVFNKLGVEKSWHDAYDTFIESVPKPTCGWLGSGDTPAPKLTMFEEGQCINKTQSKIIPHYYFAVSEDGKTYRVNNDVLKEITISYPNENGFNALLGNSSQEPILFDHLQGGVQIKSLLFEEPEVSESYHSNIVLRR